MAEQLAHSLDIFTIRQHETAGAVPQIVEGHLQRQLRPFQRGLESTINITRTMWATILAGKDVVAAMPIRAEDQSLLTLCPTPGLEDIGQLLRDIYHPPAGACLRRRDPDRLARF